MRLMQERDLFGGAICCEIPADWKDISTLRQVPDNQECFQAATEHVVFVIEILERQDQIADINAAEFFFQDLVESNQATNTSFTASSPSTFAIQGLPADSVVATGFGFQTIALGRDTDIFGNPRQQEIATVRIEVCVVRLPTQKTDILLTLSAPQDVDLEPVFRKSMSTFQIRNWSLFA